MSKLLRRTLPLLAVGLAIGATLRLAAQSRAPVGTAVPLARLRLVPDTPANRELLAATQAYDPVRVRAAFAAGGSADLRAAWTNRDSDLALVAFAGSGTEPAEQAKARAVFLVYARRVSDVNATEPHMGFPLLAYAVEMEDLPSVRVLVERGARLDGKARVLNGLMHDMSGRPLPSGGDTALHQAVSIGGTRKDLSPILTYLLDNGANPNVADAAGRTPLMEAATYGKVETVRALLAHRADPALRDTTGRTALDYAGRRHQDAVAALLDAKAPMDLGQAATFGNVARLRAALDAGGDPNALVEGKRPALNAAVASGSVEAARLLLDRGAEPNRTDAQGFAALHVAAQVGDARLVALLLAHKADPNAVAPKSDTRGEPGTPLLLAVRQARPNAVAALLPSIGPTTHDQLDAALRLAIATGGQVPSTPRSLKRERRDPQAVLGAQDKILDALLKAGASPRADGSRAVALAAENGQPGLVALMLDRGGDPNGRLKADDVIHGGATALIAAIDTVGMSQGEEEMIRKGQEYTSAPTSQVRQATGQARQAFDLLIRHGADVNLADAQGETPLMHAATMETPELMPMLAAHHARLEARRPDGRTALMLAAADGHLAIVQRLVRLGARVDVADAQGRTALMVAIDDGENDRAREMRKMESYRGPITRDELPNKDGHPALVRFLLAHGADPEAFAKDGTTALAIARKEGFGEVAKLLGGR